MASALLRGRSSTTSRTMPRYTSSLTDLSRNGEIPMMNRESGSLLTRWPAAPESGGEKLRAQRPATTNNHFRPSRPTFFPAKGESVVAFMLIRCEGWPGKVVCAKTSAGQQAYFRKNNPHPDPLPSDGRGNSQTGLSQSPARLDTPTDGAPPNRKCFFARV